jgi:hypothetical protein
MDFHQWKRHLVGAGAPPSPAGFEVPKWEHDAALHYLARASEYQLDTTKRRQLTEVVNAADATKQPRAAGLDEWMRERDRREGKAARF